MGLNHLTMNKLSPFHLAIPVKDLKKAKTFYKDILGLEEGRSSNHWIDFNFFGHQLVIHFDENSTKSKNSNPVDGKDVPIPHFGIILEWEMFNEFSQKLKNKNVEFVIEPYVRFKGLVGEQATMFFKDPSGNALEFKSFKDSKQIFAK